MKKVELRILCGNKEGHCIKRYMWVHTNDMYEIEDEIRWELEKYKAVYEYLKIQNANGYIIATAFNN